MFWTATNRHVAWGQVALHASTSELFEEALDADSGHYQRGDRWLEPEVRREVIRVRHGEDVELDVTLTRHGPLVGAVAPESFVAEATPEGVVRGIALQWTGEGPDSGLLGLLKLQHASNWPEFRLALRSIPAPATTYLYADRGGAIGMQVAGRLPVRWIDTGLLPVPGSSGFYDWRGFIPFDALPTAHGKDLPFLIASSRPSDEQFEHPVAWLWARGGAEARLREVLEGDTPLGLDEVLALQRERHSNGGAAFVAGVLAGIEPSSERARRVYRELRDWDGGTGARSTGAAVYHVFREHLVARALGERLGDRLGRALRAAREPVPGAALAEFLERIGPQTERRLAEAALEDTWSWLQANVDPNPARWSWGAVQRLRLQHDFERLGSGPLGWFGRTLGRGPFPVPGDPDSVWTMYSAGVDPFDPRVGPAFRFVVDLSVDTHAAFGLAGGQSGFSGHPQYDDALADWLDGRGRPLWMHASDVAYHGYDVWEVHPPPEVPAAAE